MPGRRRYYSRARSITNAREGLKSFALDADLNPIVMFGNLRLFKWATEKPQRPTSAKGAAKGGVKQGSTGKGSKGWFLDRNWDRAEGERLLKAKKFPQAELHLVRAVAEATAKNHSTSKRIHVALLLAESQRGQVGLNPEEPDLSKLAAAEETVRNALKISASGKDRELYIHCLDALAEIYAAQGRFDAVEWTMQEAIKQESSTRGDPLRAARRVVRLGVARRRMGRVKDAIPLLERAVLMHANAVGEGHAETANQLTELGLAYRADGRHEDAQKCLLRAMDIHRSAGQQDSPAAIHALHHLAGSLEESGDLEGAAEQYEKALTYKQRTIGSNLEDVAELQYGLANLHISWKNYARARELLYEAAGNFRRTGGIQLAVTHETLAYVDECSGRYNEAINELASAGKVWESMRPERTQELIRNMERRAELLEQLRRKGEAGLVLDKIAVLTQQLEEELAQGLAATDTALDPECEARYAEQRRDLEEDFAAEDLENDEKEQREPELHLDSTPFGVKLPLSMPRPT